jgi:DNA-binding LacI/PurR family transcriptional regulator/DNA-binding transcriptional regulator YhcF (GntR family)
MMTKPDILRRPRHEVLHVKVRERIRSDVMNGRYSSGSKIPTEAEMIEAYGVSKITVRRAIQDLSAEGLLVGQRGKGIFVNSSKFALSTNLLFVHATETPLQNSYTQLLMAGIISENNVDAPFRLELIARPYSEAQSDDDDTVEQLVKHARIDGVIALPRLRKTQMARLIGMGIPVAVIEHTDYQLPSGAMTIETGPSSSIDYQVRHAMEIGAKRIGVLTNFISVAPTELSMVHDSMRRFGIPIIPDAFERAEFGVNDSQSAALRLLRHFPDLDTIIAVDDLAALGCLHACYKIGLKVPQQVRIIGRGNMLGEHSHCGITTVDTHIQRHGKLAARSILRHLAGERVESQILIEPTFLRRETT